MKTLMLLISFITCFASIANAAQDPTLQLFYNFNKDTGKEILDASGNDLSGVVTGTKYVGGDKFGGACFLTERVTFVHLRKLKDLPTKN